MKTVCVMSKFHDYHNEIQTYSSTKQISTLTEFPACSYLKEAELSWNGSNLIVIALAGFKFINFWSRNTASIIPADRVLVPVNSRAIFSYNTRFSLYHALMRARGQRNAHSAHKGSRRISPWRQYLPLLPLHLSNLTNYLLCYRYHIINVFSSAYFAQKSKFLFTRPSLRWIGLAISVNCQ